MSTILAAYKTEVSNSGTIFQISMKAIITAESKLDRPPVNCGVTGTLLIFGRV